MRAELQLTSFRLDGRPVEVADDGASLLEALRDRLGARTPKDGCSPQGQCGCCTVWIDGQPRVACVTPLARAAGRDVTTLAGLPDADAWTAVFAATGASQCGFCTPGIVMRVAALSPAARQAPAAVHRALAAHLCRCTGWQPIVEAVAAFPGAVRRPTDAGTRRASIEGRTSQHVAPGGDAGFADDIAPADALVAVRGEDGAWHVGATLTVARTGAGRVQGRRTTAPPSWPVAVPDGEWVRTLQTTWVEPAYLEPDAAWCEPGGEPATATRQRWRVRRQGRQRGGRRRPSPGR